MLECSNARLGQVGLSVLALAGEGAGCIQPSQRDTSAFTRRTDPTATPELQQTIPAEESVPCIYLLRVPKFKNKNKNKMRTRMRRIWVEPHLLGRMWHPE